MQPNGVVMFNLYNSVYDTVMESRLFLFSFALTHTMKSERKRSVCNDGMDFDYRVFGHWSISIGLNLDNPDRFQEKRKRGQEGERGTFGVQSFS
jgi:hypothetical protein